jgi:hypothetical protein
MNGYQGVVKVRSSRGISWCLCHLFSAALDDRIDEMAEILRQHYNILEFGDPASLSEVQDTIALYRVGNQ